MINSEKVIVIDVDGTLTEDRGEFQSYSDVDVRKDVRTKLIRMKSEGYWIILFTSRNMKSYDGNIGQIMKNTAPVLIKWLSDHEVPYDEIHFGKPWCGTEGYYVDDRAIRPREFIELSHNEINALLIKDGKFT